MKDFAHLLGDSHETGRVDCQLDGVAFFVIVGFVFEFLIDLDEILDWFCF